MLRRACASCTMASVGVERWNISSSEPPRPPFQLMVISVEDAMPARMKRFASLLGVVMVFFWTAVKPYKGLVGGLDTIAVKSGRVKPGLSVGGMV